jgi:hypothetical protein
LKENVIIGKLIPAGTGFVHGRFTPVVEASVETPVVDELPETTEPTDITPAE